MISAKAFPLLASSTRHAQQSSSSSVRRLVTLHRLHALTASTNSTNNSNNHYRSASTLIIAEPTPPSSTELAPATLSSITAAQKLHSGPITLLNTNPSLDITNTSQNKIPPSITNIINCTNVQNPNLPETLSTLIQKAHSAKSYTHILAPATKFGNNIIPRAAAMIDASPIVDVIDVLGNDEFIRPMYAGNVLVKVQAAKDDVKVLTVRSTAFEKASCASSSSSSSEDSSTTSTIPSVEEIIMENEKVVVQTLTEYISSNESSTTSNRPDLSTASIVISGGRGMKDGTNFEMLYKLADKLGKRGGAGAGAGAAVGASRAAVDAGFVPNDMQVGQTGKVVAPELYIAVGISGAIQHLSGMKDSKTIVAINTDGEAPIFQIADYGLVKDLFKVLPELTDKV